jgi:hypothetical protein
MPDCLQHAVNTMANMFEKGHTNEKPSTLDSHGRRVPGIDRCGTPRVRRTSQVENVDNRSGAEVIGNGECHTNVGGLSLFRSYHQTLVLP